MKLTSKTDLQKTTKFKEPAPKSPLREKYSKLKQKLSNINMKRHWELPSSRNNLSVSDLHESSENLLNPINLESYYVTLSDLVSIPDLVQECFENHFHAINAHLLSDHVTWNQLESADFPQKFKKFIEETEKSQDHEMDRRCKRILELIEMERKKKHGTGPGLEKYRPLPLNAHESRFFLESQVKLNRNIVGHKLACLLNKNISGKVDAWFIRRMDLERSNVLNWTNVKDFAVLRDESWDTKFFLWAMKRIIFMPQQWRAMLKELFDETSKMGLAMPAKFASQQVMSIESENFPTEPCKKCNVDRTLDNTVQLYCGEFTCVVCLQEWLYSNPPCRKRCFCGESHDLVDYGSPMIFSGNPIGEALQKYVTESFQIKDLAKRANQWLLNSKDNWRTDLSGPDIGQLPWEIWEFIQRLNENFNNAFNSMSGLSIRKN